MTNLEKYDTLFISVLGVKRSDLNANLAYQRCPEWDSVGHMDLVVHLEETFDISLDSLEVTSLNTYEKGKEILASHGVEM